MKGDHGKQLSKGTHIGLAPVQAVTHDSSQFTRGQGMAPVVVEEFVAGLFGGEERGVHLVIPPAALDGYLRVPTDVAIPVGLGAESRGHDERLTFAIMANDLENRAAR
jgi:hypothetical protein